MEMLKKRWVAVVILLLVIGLSICSGLMKAPTGTDQPAVDQAQSLDTGLDTQSYTRFLYDKADLLSAQAEETILLYNANWDYRYNSVVAVVTVESTDGASLEDAAYDQGADMGLGEGDAVLLISVEDNNYYLAAGNDFSTILTNQAVDDLQGRWSRAPTIRAVSSASMRAWTRSTRPTSAWATPSRAAATTMSPTAASAGSSPWWFCCW